MRMDWQYAWFAVLYHLFRASDFGSIHSRIVSGLALDDQTDFTIYVLRCFFGTDMNCGIWSWTELGLFKEHCL